MNVLGIGCGRPNGNSEILLKAALMGAEELGAQVEMLRLNDFDIAPCMGCNACIMGADPSGVDDCVYDDDFPLLIDRILNADGIIVATPLYTGLPSGNLRIVCDRFGPSHDVIILKNQGRNAPESRMDQRMFKPFVGAFITTGGSDDPRYAAMEIAPMRQFSHSIRIQIVDQLSCRGALFPGECLLQPDKVELARILGRNVASSIGVPEEELKWLGAEEGVCPCCHGNMILIDQGATKAVCPWCAIEGEVTVNANGKVHVDFSGGDLENWRSSVPEMDKHGKDIDGLVGAFFQQAAEWGPKMERYKNFEPPVTKPSPSRIKYRKRTQSAAPSMPPMPKGE